jgi:hypothetical protein
MMKRLALLALAVLLVPSIVNAACYPANAWEWYGDPFLMPEGLIPIFAGQTLEYELAMCLNYNGSTAAGSYVTDTEGWTFGMDANVCYGLSDDGTWSCWYWYESVTADLAATIGTIDTVWMIATMCDDVTDELDPACVISGPLDTMIAYFEVVEPPPPIEIFQDTLTNVDEGVTEAYIMFEICNGDPAADPRNYDYTITSKGLVGPAVDVSGTAVGVAAGECERVYAVVDASAAYDCDFDTLTIIGWYDPTGPDIFYDTCVQVIHVITALPVPLFTTPVITVMVLAMILAAAVILRRRVASKA